MGQADAIIDSVLEGDGTLSVVCGRVGISASQAGASEQLEEDPAPEGLARFLAETHALASDRDRAGDVPFAEAGVSARGMGMERGASQMHRSGKTEGFVGECHTVHRVALDPGDPREESQRMGDHLGVARLPTDRCGFDEHLSRQGVVVLRNGETPRARERPGTRPRGRWVRLE